MAITYFKRFRMEIDLTARRFDPPTLSDGYRLLPWREELLEFHADTKYRSFRDAIDSNVFSCLGDPAGCSQLMAEIRNKDGFLPGATWLAVYQSSLQKSAEYCGTIQGIRDYSNQGAVQNLGVTPEFRGQGIGTALLLAALAGFQEADLQRAFLEVTAQNIGAIRLYQRLGFSKARTVYKAVEAAYS